jgi:hypothetical protein
MNKRHTFIWLVAACALAVRLGLLVWAGNAPDTPLTGGSDTLAYQALADSNFNHNGFSYAGMPTALRPPLYPLLLAAGQFLAGAHYRILIRLLQFVIGILTAIVCGKTSSKLGGSAAIAFAAALAAPTLIFFSAELLSETLAALIVAVFFYMVVTESCPVWVGAVIGLGMLERFNLATLAVAYVVYQFAAKKPSEAARHVALAGLVAVAVVSPWFVRNLTVFHGQVLYSTHTGTNLIQGIVTPDGRTQKGDTARIKAITGWMNTDIETNLPRRTSFPPEPQLDHVAIHAALGQMAHVNLFALTTRKLGYFWLSFDQMFRGESLSRNKRVVRALGVVVYWFLLAIGIVGWREVRSHDPRAALLFVAFAVVVTFMHLPFVMSTRIRAPLIEPELVILAGVALAAIAGSPGWSLKEAQAKQ